MPGPLTDDARVPGDSPSPGTRVVHRTGFVLTIAALVAGLAGVILVRPGSAPHEQPRPTVPLTALHLQPPISALLYTPLSAAENRISLAEQRLTTACMARQGFQYHPDPPAQPRPEVWDGPTPFGLETLETPATAAPTGKPAPAGEHDPAYARALLGDPDHQVTARGARVQVSAPGGGCLADAQQRVRGAGRTRLMQVRVLLYEAEQDARRDLDDDPEFKAANANWKRCMAERGFTWPDPTQLTRALPADTDIAASPATRADLECKDRTDYLTTAYTRLAALQQARLDDDPTIRADWTTLHRRQDTVATAILHASPPTQPRHR